MSDFMDLCVRRQSCRKFADRPVQHDDLVKCVEAARLAPSACNSQPWSFVVAEKPEIVEQIAKGAMVLGSNATIDTAKAFIVVVEEYALLMPRLRAMLDNQYFAKGDLGSATVYICLEAESLGLGTCIIGMFDRPMLRELLDIPNDKRIAALVSVGYPEDQSVRPKVRKPLEEILRCVR